MKKDFLYNYFLRIYNAFLGKPYENDFPTCNCTKNLSQDQKDEIARFTRVHNVYNKIKKLMGEQKIDVVWVGDKIVLNPALLPKKLKGQERIVIKSKYAVLFTEEEVELIKNNKELGFKGSVESKKENVVKRNNGKSLTINITRHAKLRFVSRALLSLDQVEGFSLSNKSLYEHLVSMKTWVRKELKKVDYNDRNERNLVLNNVIDKYSDPIENIMIAFIKTAKFGNEQSNHYKYRDKDGNVNYYRSYPFTFVYMTHDNAIVTTEIYDLCGGDKSWVDVRNKINKNTYQMFDTYLVELSKTL